MTSIFPFPGWRYDPGRVTLDKVMAPPYDVIGDDLRDRLYNRDDRNIVRLTLGRELPGDTPQDNRYTRAAAHLDVWRAEGLFIQDRPAIYLYEQDFSLPDGKTVTRRGFFARIRLSDWGKEGIFPHEKTLSGPKQDRLSLMRATRGNLEPVFGLLADPDGSASEALRTLADYSPCLDIADDDGVRSRMWVVDEPELLHRLLSLMPDPRIFIADGHHRYETALAYRDEVRSKIKFAGQPAPAIGELDCDYILMLVVPDSDPGLVILPTHRMLHGVKDFSAEKFLAACEENFSVEPKANLEKLVQDLDKEETTAFGYVVPGGNYLLRLRSPYAMAGRCPDACEEWRVLDVSVLHTLLLGDLLGIDEGRLLRKENIEYSKSWKEAAGAGQTGANGVQAAFILRSTPMSQVRDIAEVGAVMPQKSTYFYPKPLSGMLLYLFW